MGSSGNYSGPTGNIGYGTGVGATGPIPAAPTSGFSGAAAGAGGLSLAAAGLSAYSTVLQGQGQNAADEYKAEALERSAQVGDVRAAQTGAQLNEKLNNNLGNIDTVRAAAHADPTSPTGAAIRDTAEYQGTRQIGITVDNILEQSQQDQSDAAYLRSAGKFALLTSDVSAAAGVAKAIGSVPFGAFGL